MDDRNLTTDSVPGLMKAMAQVSEFDKTAGHKTNIAKSTVFANTQSIRNSPRKIEVHGQKVLATTTENMVGHDISVKRARQVKVAPQKCD